VSLRVEPVTESRREAVLAPEVLPEQIAFAGLPSETLPLAETDPCRKPMAVLESSRVIGFLVFCCGEQVAQCASSANTMGFRSYLIGASEQGKGYGTAVFGVLRQYFHEHHCEFTEFNLTVNTKNPRAYRAYLRAAFKDSGELYHGGAFGPQHELSLPL
jgi:RimJ/RimL family protein N-acetyltransferase